MSYGLDLTTILASSGSALVSRLTTHPLDTLRVRIQTHEGTPTIRQIIPKPWTQLYAGLPVALAFNVPGSCFYLTTYEACKSGFAPYLVSERADGKPPTLLAQAPLIVSAALAAELASGAIWTPMDVLKQRLQTGKETTKSAPVLVRKIWAEEGYRGVWRGYFFSLAQFGPYVSIYWLLYESFKQRYVPNYIASQGQKGEAASHAFLSSTTLRYTGCSALACTLTNIATNPVDIIQTRWQTSGGKITNDGLQSKSGATIKDIALKLWRSGGIKGLMRGVGVKICYSVPANAIGMTTYETLKRYGSSWQAQRKADAAKNNVTTS